MAELVWKGKLDGGRCDDTLRNRDTADLRTEEQHGGTGDQPNRLVQADVSDALPALAKANPGRVALVYIDPPFATGGTFDFLASVPDAPAATPRLRLSAYDDAAGLDAWLGWFFATAVALRDLLADGASLYVHLDAHVAHYAKVLLDEVFGASSFQREIIWRIGWVSGFKSRARGWIRNHDTLLFYAKGGRPKTFRKEFIPYPTGYTRRDGQAPRGAGYPIDDVWNGSGIDRLDSIQIVSFSNEKNGYPTQKNESLVSRVVRASSNPGDLVLDCFVGSGTTAVVAEKLGRRWIACDASPIAIHASRKRLLGLPGVTPFVVQRIPDGDPPSARQAPCRTLSARAAVDGRSANVEVDGFRLVARGLSRGARAGVKHWSQWIDGFCVDWDHDGASLRAGSSVWRARGKRGLTLTVAHRYEAAGRYVVLVRAFDILGGMATVALSLDVT